MTEILNDARYRVRRLGLYRARRKLLDIASCGELAFRTNLVRRIRYARSNTARTPVRTLSLERWSRWIASPVVGPMRARWLRVSNDASSVPHPQSECCQCSADWCHSGEQAPITETPSSSITARSTRGEIDIVRIVGVAGLRALSFSRGLRHGPRNSEKWPKMRPPLSSLCVTQICSSGLLQQALSSRSEHSSMSTHLSLARAALRLVLTYHRKSAPSCCAASCSSAARTKTDGSFRRCHRCGPILRDVDAPSGRAPPRAVGGNAWPRTPLAIGPESEPEAQPVPRGGELPVAMGAATELGRIAAHALARAVPRTSRGAFRHDAAYDATPRWQGAQEAERRTVCRDRMEGIPRTMRFLGNGLIDLILRDSRTASDIART